MNAKYLTFRHFFSTILLCCILLLLTGCEVEPQVQNPIVVTQFIASADNPIEPNSTCQIYAEAYSKNGGDLNYSYTITSGGGTLSSNTNVPLPNLVNLTTPNTGGPITVQLTITDTQGASLKKELKLWARKSWQKILQNPNGSSGYNEDRYQTICVTPDGKVYLTYQDWSNYYQLKATGQVYDGSSWATTQNGGYFTPRRAYYLQSIAGPQYPYITLLEKYSTSSYRATVYKYTGTNWQECVPGTTFGTSPYNRPQIAISSDNTLYLASLIYWAGNPPLTVQRLTATNWINVGTNIFDGSISDISLTVSKGTPIVAYVAKDKIRVKRPSAGNWVDVGPKDFIPGKALDISLITDKEGSLLLGYKLAEDSKIYVKKFEINRWNPIGSGSASPGTGSFVNLLVDSANTIHLVFQDGVHGGRVSARYFDGTEWRYTGQPGVSEDTIDFLSAAIGPDDTIYAAFQTEYQTGSSQVLMLK